ncbi:asparagine synthase-related protein [Candidatus Omnitrophota bacterium]
MQLLYFEAKTFLHGLFVVDDKLSMAHGLEVRVPFLDNDLVDFATRVPVKFKLKQAGNIVDMDEHDIAKKDKYFEKMNDGKLLARELLQKYVGQDAINQPKQGFSGPDASWFKGESIDYVKELLLDKNAAIYEFLDYEVAKDIIDEHISGKHNRRLFIWSLLCFQSWLKLFI